MRSVDGKFLRGNIKDRVILARQTQQVLAKAIRHGRWEIFIKLAQQDSC